MFVVRIVSAMLALASLSVPGQAAAHQGDPNIESVVTGVVPSLPGVVVSFIDTVTPALSAVNTSSRELEILGPDGGPFLRLGPRGAEGNVHSRIFYLTTAPGGETSPPPGLRPGAPPVWRLLSHRPAWVWYEPRIPDLQVAPLTVRARAKPTTLARWSIPVRTGGASAAVKGVTVYTPQRDAVVRRMTSSMMLAPGVTVALLPGRDPDLYLQNYGRETVTVLGQQGEPFAEISPGGVLVNLRSPVHAADVSARGGRAEVAPNAGEPPLFRRVAGQPAFDWFDPRPRLQSRWSVPVRIGARTVAITGTLAVVPTPAPGAVRLRGRSSDQGNARILWYALAAILVLALTGGLALRRHGARS